MKVSVSEVNKRNTRNAALSAYKELYQLLEEGQGETSEKWKKYTKGLSDTEKEYKEKQFKRAITDKNYTTLVRPLLDPRGRVIRWHDSFVISLLRGEDLCEIDVLGGLVVDLSEKDSQIDAIDTSQLESPLDESDQVSE